MTSVPPPGAKPTTTSIGLSSGHAADAGLQRAKQKAATSATIVLFMISSPVSCYWPIALIEKCDRLWGHLAVGLTGGQLVIPSAGV
jgi:hypothetical protein